MMNQADVNISGVRPEERRLDRHLKGIETGRCSVEDDGEENSLESRGRGGEEARMPGATGGIVADGGKEGGRLRTR